MFGALADPVRRALLGDMAAGPARVVDLAARHPISRPAVSRHLRVLREAGLVSSEIRAQRRVYRLERAALAELDAWLDRFRPLARIDDPAGLVERALPGRPGGSTRSTPRSGAAGAAGPPRTPPPRTETDVRTDPQVDRTAEAAQQESS